MRPPDDVQEAQNGSVPLVTEDGVPATEQAIEQAELRPWQWGDGLIADMDYFEKVEIRVSK